jgi:hypothetical protein
MKPICENVTVKLVGENGNAFNILGIVIRGMKKAHIEQIVIDEFYKEATSGDYDHLLQTCMKYVNVE